MEPLKPPPTTILGVDPSTTRTGLALLKKEPYHFRVLWTAVLSTKDGKYPTDRRRFDRIAQQITQLDRSFGPLPSPIDLLCYEQNFAQHPKMAFGLNQAIGALIVTMMGLPCMQNLTDIVEVRPNGGKSALGHKDFFFKEGTHQREESKAASVELVRRQFEIDVSEDEADAIGVALAGYFAWKGKQNAKAAGRVGAPKRPSAKTVSYPVKG